MSATLEKQVQQRGTDCVFVDGTGTVTVVVEHRPGAGQATYDASRERANRDFGNVQDIQREHIEFYVNDGGVGRATALSDDTLYTVSVEGFGYGPDAHQTVALQLIDAILG